MEELKTKILDFVTLEIAKKWKSEFEKILFFEYEVVQTLDLNISMRRTPNEYETLLNYFEDLCEDCLKHWP